MPFSACTKTVQNTLDWSKAFILNRPSSGVGGVANEPGLTIANLISATILSPPFPWPWNRATTTVSTVVGQADYPLALTTFGWLEKATFGNGTMSPPIKELEIRPFLSVSGKNNQPAYITVANDDNSGNITFRLMPIPDQIYTLTLTYQLAPPVIASLSSTWAPIPDKYNFLYERGMLAHLHGMYDNQAYLMEMQLFFRQLVGCSQGLDDTAKAIFLADRLEQLRTEVAAQNATTGTLKRGM